MQVMEIVPEFLLPMGNFGFFIRGAYFRYIPGRHLALKVNHYDIAIFQIAELDHDCFVYDVPNLRRLTENTKISSGLTVIISHTKNAMFPGYTFI
jgi:hypothetical protein